MPAKKKAKKSPVKSKKAAVKKKVTSKKKVISPKTLAKKKATKKKSATTTVRPKVAVAKRVQKSTKPSPRKSIEVHDELLPPSQGVRSSARSGDLQGLSDVEGPDSESVDELLEEGNAFEAGVVRGVEEADAAEESEVHTHEVPEDDVPEEYIDKD